MPAESSDSAGIVAESEDSAITTNTPLKPLSRGDFELVSKSEILVRGVRPRAPRACIFCRVAAGLFLADLESTLHRGWAEVDWGWK